MAYLTFDDLDINYSRFLPASLQAEILAVGCGRGRVLSFLRTKGYTRLTGFDQDVDAVEWVKNHVTPNVFVERDWRHFLGSRAHAFDLVIAKDVIYYLSLDRVVEHLHWLQGALKPGGRLIVEVFNGAARTGPYIRDKDYRIQWVPTELAVAALLRDAGFTVTHLFGQSPHRRGLKRRLFNFMGGCWRLVLKAIYVLERGLDEENPKVLTTKLIAVAEAPRPTDATGGEAQRDPHAGRDARQP